MSVGHGNRSQMSATARHEPNCRSDRGFPVCGALTCFRRRGPMCVAQERLGPFVVAQKDPAEASTRRAGPAGRAGRIVLTGGQLGRVVLPIGPGWPARSLKRVADDGDNRSERRSSVLVGSSGVEMHAYHRRPSLNAGCNKAKQRIYLSATLGSMDDLQRRVGGDKIVRLATERPLPPGATGERLFVLNPSAQQPSFASGQH